MDPILLDFPDSFETKRLLIRAPRPGDGAEVNAAICESLDRLRPWMPWAQTAPPEEETEANIRKACARWRERADLRLHLYLKATAEFLGGSGLHRIDWSVPKFEIGYWIRTKFEGQGLMSEAVDAITDFAFETLGARRVEIRGDPRNLRSAAIPERLGFTQEALLRNFTRDVDGNLRDTNLFVKIR